MIQSGLRIQKPNVSVVFVCLLPYVKIEILIACCIWNEMLLHNLDPDYLKSTDLGLIVPIQ